LDKLRLRDKHRRQPEVRVRLLKHRRRILPPQRSNRLRRDSKHPPRICHRGSNRRRRRQENPERPDNRRPQASRECLVQSVQQALPQPLRRVLLPLSHPLRKSRLVF
jgi:hypothetical protein